MKSGAHLVLPKLDSTAKMGGEALMMFEPGFEGKTRQQEHAFNVMQELGWR